MQGQKDSGELDIIWIVVGILLACGLVFFLFRDRILATIMWIKYFELKLISYFVVNENYQGLALWVYRTDTHNIQFLELRLLALEVGQTLLYPCMFFILALAIFVFFKHPNSGYRDIENMKTLAGKVGKTFPAINVVKGLNLVAAPVDQGPWAMADTPIEFAKKLQLIHRDPKTQAIILDHNKAKLVFTQQLGELWPGIDQLKPYQQALFAIFAAFANFKRDEAEKKMEDISRGITQDQLRTGKINFNTNAILAKYKNTPVVQRIIKQHAFTQTIFIELLSEARKSGIVLNSLCLWLKPVDRKLWYVINNVGRKSAFSEVAAIQAHWLAEKRLGFAIAQPMIDEAIFALEEAIQSRIIKDI